MTRGTMRVTILAVLALILGLLAGFSAAGAVDTQVDVTTVPGSGFKVGENVTITWTLTAQTTGTVAFSGNLQVRIKSPGSASWDAYDNTVATSGASFTTDHAFVPTKAGTYTIEGNYLGCPACSPVLNASPLASDTIDVAKAETTASVASDKASPFTEETVTLTATVAINPACATCTTPTGTVTFYEDKPAPPAAIGTASVTGAGTVSVMTSFNAVDDPVSITAVYNGDSNYNASPTSPAHSQNVSAAATTVTITSVTPTLSVVGQTYTVSGTVTANAPGGGAPTGTVVVDDPTDTSTTGTVAGDGSWSCNLVSTTEGSKTLTATYTPDTANYTGNTDTESHTVNKADTTTTVTLKTGSSNPSVTGESVTFTATVEADSPGTGTPTGDVTFKVDGTTLTTVALVSGVAEATTSFDAADDPENITAEYAGDSNYNASNNTSSPHVQNVNKPTTTVAFDATTPDDPDPSIVGQAYTVMGTVTPTSVSDTNTNTSGDVVISDGTDSVTVLGSSLTWNADHWNWTTASVLPIPDFVSTTAGIKTLTATYAGDSNYAGNSSTESHTVNKTATTTEITGVVDLGGAGTVVGETYRITGTVTPADPDGTTTTTGTVTVSDGTDTVIIPSGDLTWSTDHWNWSTASLSSPADFTSTTAGSKTITATYSGDANYEGSDDTDSPHTVSKADTTVVITNATTLSLTDTVVGQAYTVSGTVTPTDPDGDPGGTFSTTGEVEVTDGSGAGSESCTDATLLWDSVNDRWDWSCTLTSTTVGSKTITATYSGDDNYNTDGDTASHTVNQAATVIVFTSVTPNPALVGETYSISGTIDAVAPGSGIPTGDITVDDDDGNEVTVAIAGDGSWSCSLASTAAANPRELTATYDDSDDPDYLGTTSSTTELEVDPADTATTVTSSVNPSVTGQIVTLTATVASVSPGSGTPADGTTVDFEVKDKDSNTVASGSETLGDGALPSGVAEYDVAAGILEAVKSPYTVTATFNPGTGTVDPNYNTSSGTLTQHVNKPTTTTVIAGTGAATVVGQSYTVSGTVEVDTPGSATPGTGTPATAGQVVVSDGTDSATDTSLTWNTPVASKWNWSVAFISTTAGSPKTLTATYDPLTDGNYSGSSDTDSHTVNPQGTTTTITLIDPTTTVVGQPYTVTGRVTPNTNTTGTHVTPAGVQVQAENGDGSGVDTCTDVSLVWNAGGWWDWSCDLISTTQGSSTGSDPCGLGNYKEVTATFDPGDTGDPNYTRSKRAFCQTVNPATSTTTLDVLGPGTVCAGLPVLLVATVTSPVATDFNGCVEWSDGGSGGTFDSVTGCAACSGDECCISPDGECSVYYTPASGDVGTITITAQYVDNTTYPNSDPTTVSMQAEKRDTSTSIFGSDTPLVVNDTATFTVTVIDASDCAPLFPTGVVSVTVTVGTTTSTVATHTLNASHAGQFTFTYTPTSGDDSTHVFTASYAGDTDHNASSGSFTQSIIKRAVNMQLTCSPGQAYVNEPVTCTVVVADATTAGAASQPTGTVSFDDGGKSGVFSPGSATLSGGTATVTYTPYPGDAGTTTITATYDAGGASSVHATTSHSQPVVVELRPTQTLVTGCTNLLVNETCGFTVDVSDVSGATVAANAGAPLGGGTAPKGTGAVSRLAPTPGAAWLSPTSLTIAAGTASFSYRPLNVDAMGAHDSIDVHYTPDDGIHAASSGRWVQPIQRRPTIADISCTSTSTGCDCTVEVVEDPGNAGTSVSPLVGDITLVAQPNETVCVAATGDPLSCSFSVASNSLSATVTVMYEATDKIHQDSSASVTVDRSDQFEPADPDPGGSGEECFRGCGNIIWSGGLSTDALILGMNFALEALSAGQLALDIVDIPISVLPDAIWGAGIGAVAGAEIPIKDIILGVTATAKAGMEAGKMILERDMDGDGLPEILENLLYPMALASALIYSPHGAMPPIPNPVPDLTADSDFDGMSDADEIGTAQGWVAGMWRPNPADPDSDDDGLLDGEEGDYGTHVCMADTDCDTINDGDEVATWKETDVRDHADPWVQDTDGDGIPDPIEYASTSCTYINEADSDDDGLDDGTEDWNADGVYSGSVADTGTQANLTWETDPCDVDTDGDGLSDGEEFQLMGGLQQDPDVWKGSGSTAFLLVDAVGPGGAIQTIPALDMDSDDDGLSDYEEINTTMTDPLDADSDNDTLTDGNELIAVSGSYPQRAFTQVSDPLDPDTDDDGLLDNIEYSGTGLGISHGLGGSEDMDCPFVNDDDSDDDGLQDGTESFDGDDTITTLTIGNSILQSTLGPPTGETDFCNPDTDGDGLSDGEEAALMGGLPVYTWQRGAPNGFTPVTPKGVSTTFGVDGAPLTATVPALDDDSDNDGLSDYEEVNITHTDPLDQDTDNDTLSDANELISTGGTWPNRTFIQESDPLDPDTDDDDLHDQIEYPGSGLGISRGNGGTPDNICPYVNDDDSDDDGLQDGVEDANHDGTYGLAGAGMNVGGIGNTPGLPDKNGAPFWETDLCDPDTDDDGLLDGEEVGLIGGEPATQRPAGLHETFSMVDIELRSTVLPLGTSAVPAGYSHTAPSPGTGNNLIAPYTFSPTPGNKLVERTVPALDVDSDDDGLSDYEEVNITGTAPLDQDTDNDTLMDSDEVIATGGVTGATPRRTFDIESDPLDINTDDDGLFDPQEYAGSGVSTDNGAATGGDRDEDCPYVNNDDSDADGIQDGIVVSIDPALTVTGALSGAISPPALPSPAPYDYTYTHYEDFIDLLPAAVEHPGIVRTVPTPGDGEQQEPDIIVDVCDFDSDGDGLSDGEEIAIGTNPDDWDTDDDGRNDWHEVTGGGPIPTDPFDPDTDDDGLLDSAEVFGTNPTNPVNADTDGDGLCDGGTRTPWMTSGDVRIVVNPICKSCPTPGFYHCPSSLPRQGSPDGIGDHANPLGIGEDENGDGSWDQQSGETDPNQYDTDGDAVGDGIERLSFSTSRQYLIPTVDIFGRPILVVYPEANNVKSDCGCMDPLDPDSDDDGLSDGYEDRNHDGNFDFLPSEFDHMDPIPGPPIPYPTETNPCDDDTDHDGLTDWEERHQRQPLTAHPTLPPSLPIDNDGDGLFDEDPTIDGIDDDNDGFDGEDPIEAPIELTFNPTNPLDHDTDNDRILDGPEVYWDCVPLTCSQLDNDTDSLINEDPVNGLDDDGDGLIDEDPVDFTIRTIPMLDPTNRDSDGDGWLDGLDDDPCNSECIPVLLPVQGQPVDTDGDGFSDEDELFAKTHPNDPDSHPIAYGAMNLDLDDCFDDRIWLEPVVCCGYANSVAIDIDSDMLLDARIRVIQPRDVHLGDFDDDGHEDDARYIIEFAFANYRAVQPRIIATIDDYDIDLVIDHVSIERR